MRLLKIVLAGLLALAAALLGAGQIGLLQGAMPVDLGVRGGRLKAPSTAPNSVSSQAHLWPGHPQQGYAQIEPLPGLGDAARSLARIEAAVRSMPGARVVATAPDYLYATFDSRWLRFTDDVEFWWDDAAQVVQVRSASRLGHSDLGVNRARVEALRALLAAT